MDCAALENEFSMNRVEVAAKRKFDFRPGGVELNDRFLGPGSGRNYERGQPCEGREHWQKKVSLRGMDCANHRHYVLRNFQPKPAISAMPTEESGVVSAWMASNLENKPGVS